MLYGTSLARKTTTLDGGDNVILANAVGYVERLVDDEAQRRACEIDGLVAAIDHDLAGAGLQPDAGNRILAAAGCISAALRIDFFFAQRGCGRCRSRTFGTQPQPFDVAARNRKNKVGA